MTGNLIPGDLVLFVWPDKSSGPVELLDWEGARLGLVCEILVARPGDSHGNELLVLHEGERWSVPELWCSPVRREPK